jgi:cell division GTPase FtsZ
VATWASGTTSTRTAGTSSGVTRDEISGIRGVVVRVATGERLVFRDLNRAGSLLQEMIEADLTLPASRDTGGSP